MNDAGKLYWENTVEPHLASKGIKRSSYGKAELFLGMHIDQKENGVIDVTQKAYIDEIYHKFVGDDNKEYTKVTSPLPPDDVPGDNYMALTEADELDPSLDYRSLIGSLMYPSTKSKPETCFAVCLLARYTNC